MPANNTTNVVWPERPPLLRIRPVRRMVAVGALLVVLTGLVDGAAGAPTTFTLSFHGIHVLDPNLPAGIRHEGRFTASAPFCSSGKAVDTSDLEIEPLTVLRTHTCDDGSGSFTAFMPNLPGEHGGNGTWKIVDGTGRYATLRGLGTYAGHIVSGDPGRFETIVYTTTWQGVVDFDAVPPTFAATATSKKLRKPTRTYTIRTVLNAQEGQIAYSVDIRAGKSFLAFKQGTSASGRMTVALRIRAPKGARNVQVIVTVTDAVGNESTTTRAVRLK